MLAKAFNNANKYNVIVATWYHAKVSNTHAGPLEDVCQCHAGAVNV